MLYMENIKQCTDESEMMKTINQEGNKLSKIFFSKDNIDLLQKLIYTSVLNQSGYKIDRQSNDHILIVMRSMYTLYANSYTDDIKEETIKLNTKVVDKCSKVIITNILMYFQYVNDASRLPIPLSRSEFISSKGDDMLEFKSFF